MNLCSVWSCRKNLEGNINESSSNKDIYTRAFTSSNAKEATAAIIPSETLLF